MVAGPETWIVPIPDTTKLDRLQENLGATDVLLGPEDLAEIAAAASRIELHGARPPESALLLTGR